MEETGPQVGFGIGPEETADHTDADGTSREAGGAGRLQGVGLELGGRVRTGSS